MISEAYLMDCMEYMEAVPDKWFDLCLCDPEYGIGEDGKKNHSRGKLAKPTLYPDKKWDRKTQDQIYFNELRRISKHQIIWGANHFISKMPYDSPSWIVWDKLNGDNDFADCELAWTSHKTAVRIFRFKWAGMLQGDMKNKEIRIHVTQKPVALYKWIYHNYIPNGGKVFDSHAGSNSNRIAADMAGNIDYYSTEIDPDYFNDAEKRWREYKAQAVITFPDRIDPVQSALF